jgi:hypothetical protein
MKFTKATTGSRLLAVGLLAVTLPTILKDFIHIPDFFRGFMMGLGLTMEVIGIILMRRQKVVQSK